MRTCFFILTIGLLFGSCRGRDGFFAVPVKTFGAFPVTATLTVADTLPVSGMGAFSLAISDSLLTVGKVGTDSFLSVVNLDDNSVCDNLCLHGRGPGEYTMAFTCNKQFVRDGGANLLYTFDMGQRMLLVDLTESIRQHRTIIRTEENLRNLTAFSQKMLYLNDGRLFVKYNAVENPERDNRYFPGRYVIYDRQREQGTEIPFFGSKMDSEHLGFLARTACDGSVILKPDGTKAVDAMLNFDYLNIIDLEKRTGFTLRNENALTYEAVSGLSNEERMRRMRFAYFDLAVTDKYVFAAYCGNSYEAGFDSPDNITTLRVFDWNGNPLASMQFDRRIMGIAFRERTGLLYGLDTEENIVVYDLNELVKKFDDEI